MPANAAETAMRPGRLPAGVVPVHYAIHVDPDATGQAFEATAVIDVKVEQATATIVLNALELDIRQARIDGTPVASLVLEPAAQTLTLRASEPLPPGPHRLAFDYAGKIYPTATSLFFVDYPSGSGTQRMLTTQFEVGDARRFAPMWDEPTAKATFELEVAVPKNQSAYSNMPVASTRHSNGKQIVRFQTTPKMSSYLLHLTVGELERIATKVAGVDVGVVTRKGASEKGRSSLEAAAQLLPWYNEYFGTPYPLPKLDMIAVPGSSQFFGAMENWGAIMYFEPALLIDPERSSESQRMGVFSTVAHEMAHQWFGNLVTMNWWDELWLNEGYATWMGSKATRALRPSWDVALAQLKWEREYAMRADAGSATHAIVQEVVSVDDASQAFDSIAYNKGSTVIGMIEATAGETAFRAGIRRYMRKHAYGNAVTEKLWAELGAATNQPIVEIARDFTLQPGVPLVKAEAGACQSGKSRVTLSQGRFETGTPSPVRQTWRIPVRVLAIDTGRTTDIVLGKDGAAVSVEAGGCGPFVINAGQQSYFRAQYAMAELVRLRDGFSRLTDVDRLGLLADTAALAANGTIDATGFLELSKGVPADSHPYILSQLAEEFVRIDRWLDDTPQQAGWRAYARKRLTPIFERIGWEPAKDEGATTALLRESLITTLGRLEEPAVLTGARDRYLRAAKNPKALPAAIYGVALQVAARHADATTWDEIHRRAQAAKDPREQQELYGALGMAKDPALSQRALELALSGEPPSPAVGRMVRNVAAERPAEGFAFAVAHEEALLRHIDGSSKWGYIPSLPAFSSDAGLAQQVEDYTERAIPPDARSSSRVTVATIRQRSATRQRQAPAVAEWLKTQS